MKHSCGAILYAYDPNGDLGIILGMEGTHWLPFKGGCEGDETFEDAAVREIYEETCKLVPVKGIDLEHNFSTKHKHYHIGIHQVPYDIIKRFPKARKSETEKKYMEKQCIKFFPIGDLLGNKRIHSISRASIEYFWTQFIMLASNRQVVQKDGERLRTQGYPSDRAQKIFDNNNKQKKKGSFFRQPPKFNLVYTPNTEKYQDSIRVWRRETPLLTLTN